VSDRPQDTGQTGRGQLRQSKAQAGRHSQAGMSSYNSRDMKLYPMSKPYQGGIGAPYYEWAAEFISALDGKTYITKFPAKIHGAVRRFIGIDYSPLLTLRVSHEPRRILYVSCLPRTARRRPGRENRLSCESESFPCVARRSDQRAPQTCALRLEIDVGHTATSASVRHSVWKRRVRSFSCADRVGVALERCGFRSNRTGVLTTESLRKVLAFFWLCLIFLPLVYFLAVNPP